MEMAANLIGGMFILMAIGILIAFVLGVYWIWMLVDCIKNQKIQGTEKAVWVLIVLGFNWLGGLVYYFTVRKGETTGFLNFIGLGFAVLTLVFLVVGFMYSTKIMVKGDKEINNTKSRQESAIMQTKQIRKTNLPVGINKKTRAKSDDQPQQSNYLLLNKSDENRGAARTPHEIANINTSKYSEKLNSWIDGDGKVHFSNSN